MLESVAEKLACNADVFSERAHFVLTSERILTKRAPSWIQSRKRLGERIKGFLVSGC